MGSDVANTSQQEPSNPLLLLDGPEYGFHQLLSPLERPAGLVCGHPSATTAQDSVIGAYCQAPAGRTTGDSRSGKRTRLANMLGGLVYSLVRFPGEPAAYQAQYLTLGTPVCAAVGNVGGPVLVVGIVQGHSSGQLRHRHLLTAVSAFL